MDAFLSSQPAADDDGAAADDADDLGPGEPNLSEAMSDFLGGATRMKRFTVVKRLWEHIKGQGLQARACARGHGHGAAPLRPPFMCSALRTRWALLPRWALYCAQPSPLSVPSDPDITPKRTNP